MTGAPTRVTYVLDTSAMGGTEIYLATLVRHLDDRRVAPSVVLSPATRDLPLGAMLTEAGAAVHYHAMPRDKGDLRVLAGLVGLLRRLGPRVAHIVLPYTLDNRYAFLAARLAGCRVVVSTEELAAEAPVFRPRRARVVKRVLAGLQTRIIASSEDVRTRLIDWARLPARKIVTIHNGIELPPVPAGDDRDDVRRELRLDPSTPLVGMVARLALRQKRFEDFLAAAWHVSVAVPAAHFLVVGGGKASDRAVLDGITRDLGLERRVHFLGHRTDARRLIAALDVFVLATQNEGFPLVTLEAMALGTPVVATDLVAMREQIVDGDSGYLVPPRDANRLAECVLTLLRDPAGAREMAARARRLVERRFSADEMAERTQALYGDLLAPGAAPALAPVESEAP